jgi:hypothetical protein
VIRHARSALLGPKQDEILAQDSNLPGHIGRILDEPDRVLVAPHQFAHRLAGADLRQIGIVGGVGRPYPRPSFDFAITEIPFRMVPSLNNSLPAGGPQRLALLPRALPFFPLRQIPTRSYRKRGHLHRLRDRDWTNRESASVHTYV